MTLIISSIIILAFLLFLGGTLFKAKDLIRFAKQIPAWLFISNTALLLCKIFLIPHVFSSKSDYGIFMLEYAKETPFFVIREGFPVFSFLIRGFSYILQGVGFEFIVNLHSFFAYLNIFSIFLIVLILFKHKIAAASAAVMYAASPLILITSLTEEYTNPAVFFSIQALLWASIFYQEKKVYLLIPSLGAAILAMGTRPEYALFFILYLMFIRYVRPLKPGLKFNMIIAMFVVLAIPLLMNIGRLYLNSSISNPRISPVIAGSGSSNWFIAHSRIFLDNLPANIYALTNPFTLTGIFLFFALGNLFAKTETGSRKFFWYFIFYFLSFFIYYCFLHIEGIYNTYRYIATLILPLAVLGGLGLAKIFANKKIFIIPIIAILPVAAGILILFYPDKFIYNFSNNDEYAEYKIWQKNLPLIKRSEKTKYLSYSQNTFFYAFPFPEKNIFPIDTIEELDLFLRSSSPDDKVYVSQGPFNCNSGQSRKPGTITADEFEAQIKQKLILKEVIFSKYYDYGGHIYLYLMAPRPLLDK